MISNTSLRRIIKLTIGVGIVLPVVMIGYVAWGAEQKAPARPPNEDRGSPKVELNPERLKQELDTLPEGETVQLNEKEYPEIYAGIRAEMNRLFPEQQIPAPRPPMQSQDMVETTGGFLSIVERGDGVVHLLATAFNHDSPDLENADFGLAFSAIITADGIQVTSVDPDGLARFVRDAQVQEVSVSTDAGVASVGTGIGVVVGPCTTKGDTTCCLVVTDKQACTCCFTFGGTPTCHCTPLAE